MRNFRHDDRSSGGRRDFGQRDFGRRSFGDRRDRQMYKAVCSNCGKDCEVPFMPTGSKPVYCSECFEKMGGGSDSRRFSERAGRQPQNNAQFEAINAKLDKILAILAPSSVEPAKKEEAEKEIKVSAEKPIVVFEKKTKISKKTAPTSEE